MIDSREKKNKTKQKKNNIFVVLYILIISNVKMYETFQFLKITPLQDRRSLI